MSVNESVYGAKNTWLTIKNNSTVKFANFGDNNGTIQKGFQTGKLKTDTQYNNSIVHSALGNESALSRFKTYKGKNELSAENYNSLQWSFACGSSVFQPVSNSSTDNTTNMLAPITNSFILNSNTRPVVDFSYKNVRAVIRVYAKQSENGQAIDKSLHDYCENFSANYPYIERVYMYMYEKINNNWVTMSTNYYLGILIHNETKYFSHTHAPSKTFESGIIGSVVCTNYGSGADVPEITLLGVMSQRLSDNRIYTTDINIVSGDLTVTTDLDGRGIFHLDYYNDFETYAMRQCACFGIQFVCDSADITIDLDSTETTEEQANKVYFGVLDSDYIGHGDFIQGKAITSDKRYNKTANDNEYNPDKPVSDLNSKRNNTTGAYSGGKMYVVDELGIDTLINALCGAMTGDIVSDEDRYKMSLNFGDKSPLDYVTSFRFCPFTISGGTATNTINVFNKPITASSSVFHPLLTSIKRVTRSINVIRLFNDFRAYSPFTSLQLYVPFCDTIELNPSEWYDTRLTLDYFFNLSTGDVTCCVMRNNLDFAVLTGTFLYDIPLTAENNNAYRIAVSSLNIDSKYNDINTLISQVNSGANVISNAVTGNVGGMLSGFTSMINNSVHHAETREKLELQYQATKPSLCKSGSANATNNFMLDFDGKLIYKYRDFDMDLTNYADTVGYACLENGSLSECSHLTKMINTKIDVSLPQDIINAMTGALNTGIIM